MIDLYTWTTPNGWKASCTLEELALPYEAIAVDISTGAQKSADFLRMNPNGRIPVIIDRARDNFTVFESGAIMIYLAELAGKLLPTDAKKRSLVEQWLMFQMGGLGPMQGQANMFYRYFPERIPTVINRYQQETRRLLTVLNTRLSDEEYLAGDFSIADIANWCWARLHDWAGVSIEGLDHLQRWINRIEARPACARGLKVPFPATFSETEQEEKETFIKEAQSLIEL